MTATQEMIDRLRCRAEAIARPFLDAAAQPGATASERAFGEAARLILRDAEKRAKLLPREEFEERVDAFKEWHRRQEAAMQAEITRLAADGHADDGRGAIGAARRRATEALDRREAEFDEWVEGYALAAWIRATEDLLTLDRPSASICTRQSPVRH